MSGTGRNLPLSLPRRLLADMMDLGQRVPTVAVERPMNLAALAAAREASRPRPSWSAIFTKAFGIVTARRPELRRAYIPFPYAHLYEHDTILAGVLMERQFGDEPAAFRVDVRRPERHSLVDLDAYLKRCKEQPVETLPLYRRYRRLAWLPGPVRRRLLRLATGVSGRLRARHFGTFEVSTVAGAGADLHHVLTMQSVLLHYGRLDASGTANVKLVFDHRVFDGGTAARALVALDDVLSNEVLAELHDLAARAAA